MNGEAVMRLIVRILAVALLSVGLLSCSSGSDGTGENVPAVEHAGSAAAPAADIEGFMGLMWGDGTDVLLDSSMYDIETLMGSEVYSLKGGTHHLEDYGVDVDYEVYEFVDGSLVSGEVGGNNMGHMNRIPRRGVRAA